jgi:hypothetical protein
MTLRAAKPLYQERKDGVRQLYELPQRCLQRCVTLSVAAAACNWQVARRAVHSLTVTRRVTMLAGLDLKDMNSMLNLCQHKMLAPAHVHATPTQTM